MYFYSLKFYVHVCMNAADCWHYFYYEVIYDLMNHELF